MDSDRPPSFSVGAECNRLILLQGSCEVGSPNDIIVPQPQPLKQMTI